MDTAILGMTFAAALAFGLIRNARAYAAARRREAEFFARRLHTGRFASGQLYPSGGPRMGVTAVAYTRLY